MTNKLKKLNKKKPKKNQNMIQSQIVKINLEIPKKTKRINTTQRQPKKQSFVPVQNTQPIIIRQEPFKYTPLDTSFKTANFDNIDNILATQFDKLFNEKVKSKENNIFNRTGAFLAGDNGQGLSEDIMQLNKKVDTNANMIDNSKPKNDYLEVIGERRGPGRPKNNIIKIDPSLISNSFETPKIIDNENNTYIEQKIFEKQQKDNEFIKKSMLKQNVQNALVNDIKFSDKDITELNRELEDDLKALEIIPDKKKKKTNKKNTDLEDDLKALEIIPDKKNKNKNKNKSKKK